jgi:hypothetical protein
MGDSRKVALKQEGAMTDIEWLQRWYKSNCVGDWEHRFGIKMDTIDNPGWLLEVDLSYTDLEDIFFEPVDVTKSDHDWFYCYVKDNQFCAYGDPFKLAKLISIFRTWAESHQSLERDN